MRGAALALALIGAPLAAQNAPQPTLADGETLEVETRADFNGDGVLDLAYVKTGEDGRQLLVVTSQGQADGWERWQVENLILDPYPLGDATLEVKGNVLLLKDLTGGTTAVASTHRFRRDENLRGMRLIGLDATLYSRTYAHDGKEVSWNLLTGDLITRTLRLNTGAGEPAYDKVGETRRTKVSKPLRLEQSPSGDDLLGWPGAK